MASRLSKQCTISHICAVGLRDTDIIGKHSPLVKFQLGKQEVKTSVAPKAGTEVAWDSVLVLPSEADVDELVIMVYNHHLLRPDNLVGRATLPLSQLESGHGSTKVTLLDKAGKPAGELSFRVQHAGSGHLHTTSAHPEAVADPAAAYKVDEGSHRNHPPPSSQAGSAAGYTGAADTGAPHHGGGMIHDPEGYGLSKEEQGAKQGHVNHPEAVTGTAGYTRGGATLINPPPMHERRRPSPHGYGAEKVDDPIVGGDATTEGAKGSKFETAKLEAVGKTAGAVDAVEDKLQQKKNVLLEHREEVPLGEQPTFTERVREATFNTMSVIQDTAEQAKQMFLGKHAPDPAPTAAVGGDTQAAPTTRPEL
ncbi:hypothetical protein WJX72_002979 [[Myrmecia] bisecta]|uniref:C2 domain-containing protein n=1 Tax=[Myrmecia] bisecta TaxID=41462 RepID=A0AAW1QPQ8_9CHLO